MNYKNEFKDLLKAEKIPAVVFNWNENKDGTKVCYIMYNRVFEAWFDRTEAGLKALIGLIKEKKEELEKKAADLKEGQ